MAVSATATELEPTRTTLFGSERIQNQGVRVPALELSRSHALDRNTTVPSKSVIIGINIVTFDYAP